MAQLPGLATLPGYDAVSDVSAMGDGDRFLRLEELQAARAAAGLDASFETTKDVIDALDADNDGQLSETEFSAGAVHGDFSALGWAGKPGYCLVAPSTVCEPEACDNDDCGEASYEA